MKHIIFICMFIVLGSLGVRGNDGIYYVSGNQLIPLQESDVTVQKEILTISIKDDGFADVDVYYEFFNKGKEKEVLMGFEADPPYNANHKFSHKGIHPDIFDFTINMNGVPLQYSNAVVKSEQNRDNSFTKLDLTQWKHGYDDKKTEEKILAREDVPSDEVILYNEELDSVVNFSYSYYFPATFLPNVNIVKHHYRYRLSTNVGYLFGLDYKLTPATRWANHKIDDFTLIVKAENTAKHFVIDRNAFPNGDFKVIAGSGKIKQRIFKYDDTYAVISLRNGAVEWHETDYCPKKELSIISADVLIDTMNKKQLFNQSLFYDRGESYPAIIFQEEKVHTPFQRRIIRNLPYASRGYIFHDAKLKNYFKKVWWYMPDENYSPSTDDFTKRELRDIRTK